MKVTFTIQGPAGRSYQGNGYSSMIVKELDSNDLLFGYKLANKPKKHRHMIYLVKNMFILAQQGIELGKITEI